jgi:integrase
LAIRGEAEGPLFCPINRAGLLSKDRHLSGEAIRQILRRRAQAAGLADISPHDLRRTFAGDLLDAGVDLAVVQTLMGHASPVTTAKYDRRGIRASREAAEKLRLTMPGD